MRVLGVDPGISGALVLLEDRQPILWAEMPTYTIGATGKTKRVAQLGTLLRSWNPDLAVVERVASRPGQGVVSMFSFGHATGSAHGAIMALGIPMVEVTPQEWKKRMGIATGSDKDVARILAMNRWPSWTDIQKNKARGQALADAAMIALTGEESCRTQFK